MSIPFTQNYVYQERIVQISGSTNQSMLNNGVSSQEEKGYFFMKEVLDAFHQFWEKIHLNGTPSLSSINPDNLLTLLPHRAPYFVPHKSLLEVKKVVLTFKTPK